MKTKYHIWIFLGLLIVVITTISFWGISGYIVYTAVAFMSFYTFVICYPLLWLIFWRKSKKEIKKTPGKMTYLYWSKDDNGRPVAKAIEEKELE